MKKVVFSEKAPAAIGPYSQAVKVNGLVFTSGQIAINPASGNVEAVTIEEQTEQVCTNLKNALEAAGSSLEKSVKTVCFLTNLSSVVMTQNLNAQSLTVILIKDREIEREHFHSRFVKHVSSAIIPNTLTKTCFGFTNEPNLRCVITHLQHHPHHQY